MRAQRLISLLVLLQTHRRLTAAEAADRLGVSIRTIRRDLDELSGAGVPVYTERGRGGGLRLQPGYSSRLSALAPEEAEALTLLGSPAVLADLHMQQDVDGALRKIAVTLPAMHRARADQARHRLLFDPTPWFREATASDDVTHLEQLREAIWADGVCDIDYQRGDGVAGRYRVATYALVAKVDLWYLVGRTADGMRVFRISRISGVEPRAEVHSRDPDFDLGQFWRAWCRRFESQPLGRYRVTLDLSAEGRRRLLERHGAWHAAALADWPSDCDRRTVTVDLESVAIAAKVLFEIAGEFRLRAPDDLRQLLRERAMALLAGMADGQDP